MRMRIRANLEQRLAACSGLLINAAQGLPAPLLHIEIGCGKGGFITETAALHPEINYIAIEKVSNVIVLAMEKAKERELENLKFIRGDFAVIAPEFPDRSVDRIYLNFSDPWPKNGYAKRRLTHGSFLEQYARILRTGGEIHFKTDNRALFDFSLEAFRQNGFSLKNVSFDLPPDAADENVMTEYERRFRAMGVPICRLEAVSDK